MIPELLLKGTGSVTLAIIPGNKYHDTWLPGSTVYHHEDNLGVITIQESINPFFAIGYRVFRFFRKMKLTITEKNAGICFKAVLSGELSARDSAGRKIKVRTGEYLLTNSLHFTTQFKKGISNTFFLVHYSRELLDELGFTGGPDLSRPLFLNNEMKDIIHEILHNPYEEKLRDFFYENSVRELLFLHLSSPKDAMPAELTDNDIAKIHKADAIILENLHAHFSIRTLSKMAGTNEFKLKKGFRQIFGMGVFARLLERRMVRARQLLETTDKPIWEVAEMAGYDTLAGFIKAFRKKFGKTPRQWRMKNDK